MNSTFDQNENKSYIVTESVSADELLNDNFDYGIFSVGYESRSTYFHKITKSNIERKIVVELPIINEALFNLNSNEYKKSDSVILSGNIDEVTSKISQDIMENKNKIVSVFFDISSFPRTYIAHILQAINNCSIYYKKKIEVNIVYVTAKFIPPATTGPIMTVGPVTRELAGWPNDPNLPIGCIVGLGHEKGRALGILEYIEPHRIWCLSPEGDDERFIASVKGSNEGLDELDSCTTLDYSIFKPYQTYQHLNSLISSLLDTHRIVIVPLGPKILFAISTILAMQHYPEVSLWRVSSDSNTLPIDHKASGRHSAIKVSFFSQDKNMD